MTTTSIKSDSTPLRLSIIIEWANTEYNGSPRAKTLLSILGDQWQAVLNRNYPENLPEESRTFCSRFAPQPELIIVSGTKLSPDQERELQKWLPDCFNSTIHIAEGLEYYALKNRGAELVTGDILLFVDSDVHPEPGWMPHLLGSFSRPEIHAITGQPYVAPTTLFAKAFSLGWTYDLRDKSGLIAPLSKFYANNIAFDAHLFRQTTFPELNRRTRGAGSLLGKRLQALGHSVWQNGFALVDHPAPSSFKHLMIRALAHGRDVYMKETEDRSIKGLRRSQSVAAFRLFRGFSRTLRRRSEVEVNLLQVPIVFSIIATYYGFFSLGGVLTHVSPSFFGSRFRI